MVRTNAVQIVTPGTGAPGPVSIARSEDRQNVKVAANTAIANWSRRSSSSALTIRGENCPIASWIATRVTVRTVVVSGTTAEVIVARICAASVAFPVRPFGSNGA